MDKFRRILSFSLTLAMTFVFMVSAAGCSAKEFFSNEPKNENSDPSTDGVLTNSEWLAMVNDAFGMVVDEEAEDGELDAAKQWGVVGEDETIDMDAPISDQFATKTLVRAAGFVPPDASDEEIIQSAIEHGVITNDEKISDPQNAVQALSDTAHEWSTMTYEYKEDVKYAENVQDLTQSTDKSDFTIDKDDTVTISSRFAENIGTGSVFILPPNDVYEKGIALKAVSVVDNGNGTTTIKSVGADKKDLYSNIFVQGSFDANKDSIITYDDDTEITVSDSTTGMSFTAPHRYENGIVPLSRSHEKGSICQMKNEDFTLNGCDISVSKTVDGITYSAGVSEVKLNAKIDYSLTKVKEMRATVDYKTKFGVGYEKEVFEKEFELGGKNYLDDAEAIREVFEVGNISFTIYYGISVDFTVYIVVSASGSVSLEISQSHTKGFEWKDGNLRNINESGTPELDFKIACEVGVNLKFELSLNLYLIKDVLDHKLFAVSISVGPRLSGEITVRDDMTCVSVTGYIGVDFEIDLDLIFKKYNLTVGIWTSDNSPFKFVDMHYEITETQGFHKVDGCTHGAEVTTGPVTTIPSTDEKLVIGTAYLSLSEGASGSISIKSSPVDKSYLIWESSDTSVVTVDSSGNVKAGSKNGSAIITVKTPDGKQTAKCSVKVNAAISNVNRPAATDNNYEPMSA